MRIFVDKEGLTWDKVSKEKLIITLTSVDAPLYNLCLVICCTCSRHLCLFVLPSMPDKCARNLVSSLLVKTWHVVYAWWHRRRVPCLWECFFQGGHKQRGTVETQLHRPWSVRLWLLLSHLFFWSHSCMSCVNYHEFIKIWGFDFIQCISCR